MKQSWKKTMAWMLTAAMVISGSCFSGDLLVKAYAEETQGEGTPAVSAPEEGSSGTAGQETGKSETLTTETAPGTDDVLRKGTSENETLNKDDEPGNEARKSAENGGATNADPVPEATEPSGDGEEPATEPAPATVGTTFGENLIVSWAEDLGYVAAENQIVSGEDVVAEYGENNTFTIHSGKVTLKTKDTYQGTVTVDGGSDITLAGASIEAISSAAITIAAGVTATIQLAEDTENTVTGASGYAGIGVGWEKDHAADLTIDGEGSLTATGQGGGAGIGGSKNLRGGTNGMTGNITIKGGNITATGNDGGAGIGTANNPNGGTSSGSYKSVEDQWGTIRIQGGTITATGNGGGAGIGGGNHVDSGKVIIDGGTIDAFGHGGGAGIGAGLGSSNYNGGNGGIDKGHGYYYADVEINGGIISAAADWLSAGIGGGYEGDAIIKITGGTIVKAIGGDGNANSDYQGAPGIGAGYQGNVQFEMTGGTIQYAQGGTSAPGIGYGAGLQGYGKKRNEASETVPEKDSLIKISGGVIELARGGLYAAGIGTGNGGRVCNIEITGGDITAQGYASSEEEMKGGAGIGSGVGLASGLKYSSDTDVNISITGGNVTAIGGWGASGIGSGAINKMAETITIAADAKIEAYADGTKFAIDTRILNEDGSTSFRTEGREITTPILQGTYVHDGQIGDYEQNPEGLKSIQIINDRTHEVVELVRMPEGYRSFAASVAEEGTYTVYTDEASIGQGQGRYFSRTANDVYSEDEVLERNVQYTVTKDGLADNCYLYPVKTIVVSKVVEAVEGADLSGLNQTVHFALKQRTEDGDKNDVFFEKDGEIWVQSIDIVDGVPQNKVYFVNVEDRTYDVWEVTFDEEGNVTGLKAGGEYGDYILKSIDTRHGEDNTNNATISDQVWSDEVAVVNTYNEIRLEQPEEPEQPDEPGDEPDKPQKDPDPEEPTGDPADDPAGDPTDDPAGDSTDDPAGDPEDDSTGVPEDDPAGDPAPGTDSGETPALVTPDDPAGDPVTVDDVIPTPGVTTTLTQVIRDNRTPLATPELEEVEDNEVPLAGTSHHHHTCCLLHLLLMVGAMATIALYSRRRKTLGKDMDNLKAELLALAEETGFVERYIKQKGVGANEIDAEEIVAEAMKDEYMVR